MLFMGIAFRPIYQSAGMIKAILDCSTILFLTATAIQVMVSSIIDKLCLTHGDVQTIAVVPNRLYLINHGLTNKLLNVFKDCPMVF